MGSLEMKNLTSWKNKTRLQISIISKVNELEDKAMEIRQYIKKGKIKIYIYSYYYILYLHNMHSIIPT